MISKNSHLLLEKNAIPCAGLFDKIICAIKQEKEFKQTRKLLVIFLLLLIASTSAMPFSTLWLAKEWKQSGINYFIAMATEHVSELSLAWKDVALSVFDALPLLPTILFALNISLLLFCVRLFLYKKAYLVRYIKYNISHLHFSH